MKLNAVTSCVDPLDLTRRRHWIAGLLLFAFFCFVPLLFAAEPAQQTPSRTSTSARTQTASDKDEPQVVEEESDRAREQNAERNARRIVATLIRGPYLQMGTPDSMVVRWRTDKFSPSVVRFGLSATNLKFSARTRGLHTDHVVMLTNLTPDTRYFYALGTNLMNGSNTLASLSTNATSASGQTNSLSGTNRPGGNRSGNRTPTTRTPAAPPKNFFNANIVPVATNSFVTAPPRGTPKPTRVWVLGDPGTRQPPQKAVMDGFSKFSAGRPIDLWLMLGDNAYDAGTDNEYQGSIFLAYIEPLRQSVLWPTLGNHDGDSATSPAQAGAYFDIFTLPTQGQAGGVMSGTEAYYSFDYANVHFVCLDSYDSDRTTNGMMFRWIKSDLASNTQTWTIVYFHHPPHTKASHDSDNDRDGDARSREIREHLLPALEAGGADLILCGHSHGYERTPLIDGYYKRSTNFTRAFVKEGGDGCEESGGPYRKPTVGSGSHEGTVYVVAGSSGQISGIRSIHPAMIFALNVAGSLALDFNGPHLDVTFVDTNGLRRDYFSMVKGAPVATWPLAKVNHSHGAEKLRPSLSSTASASRTRLASLLGSASKPAAGNALANATAADRDSLVQLYSTSTNAALKSRLTWPLAAMADAQIAKLLVGTITNKIRDRTISDDEEQLRLTTLRALGLLASRYDPALDFLRKGLSADWWYFRTNYMASRPMEQSAADLTSSTIAALALSGRVEAFGILQRGRTNYVEFTAGEPEVLVRNYTKEYDAATNALAQAILISPVEWRRRVLAAELDAKPD